MIIVKHELYEEAKSLFSELQVQVCLSARFLGSYIGEESGIEELVHVKVESWVDNVLFLSSQWRESLSSSSMQLLCPDTVSVV